MATVGHILVATMALFVCLAAAQGLKTDEPKSKAISAGAEYRLGPEDMVQVFVWKEPDLSATIRVRPDGKIALPLIGEVEASGRTTAQLQEEIVQRLRQYVVQPVVSVIVKEVNNPRISVLGHVRKPDVYTLRKKMNLLDAIAMAGGFSDFAKRDSAVIIRSNRFGRKVRIFVDLKRLLDDSRSGRIYLQPQDQIYVE